ncbi:MAG: hypothetical protein Q9168_002892 [Polycauliona sp. 1 TL-2023]
MPLAAISSLITLLTHSPPSTTSETLSLLSHHSSILKRSVRNPIALSAGTDLFQRYIISTLQSSPNTQSTQDFHAIRDQLVANGEKFVTRAQEARGVIARIGVQFVQDGSTVLTSGRSRVVSAVLNAAADKGVRFRVVFVRSDSFSSSDPPGSSSGEEGMIAQLRRKGVPIAVIQSSATAYSLGKVSMVMVGAEGVVENGGIVSRMGTYQLAVLAKSMRKPVYVVSECHKFVRLYPLGQYDLPIQQTVVDFCDQTDDEGDAMSGAGERKSPGSGREIEEAVDFTPPELITALVTETGVHTPSAVSEELIKIWY